MVEEMPAMATKGSTYFAQSCVSVVITLLKTVAKFKNGAKFESGANKFSHYQEYICRLAKDFGN